MFSFFFSSADLRRAQLMTRMDDGDPSSRRIPLELRFAYQRDATHESRLQALLQQGYGLLIDTAPSLSQETKAAIETVARQTQAGTCHYWLSRVWLRGEAPLVTDEEIQQAADRGIPLQTHVYGLLQWRQRAKRVALVDLAHLGISAEQAKNIERINTDAAFAVWLEGVHHYLLSRESRAWPLWQAGLYSALVAFPITLGLLSFSMPLAWLWITSAYDVARFIREQGASVTAPGSWRSKLTLWRLWYLSTIVRIGLIALATNRLQAADWGWVGGLFGITVGAQAILGLGDRLLRSRTRYLRLRERGKIVGSWRVWSGSLLYDAWYAVSRISMGLTAVLYPLLLVFIWRGNPAVASSASAMTLMAFGFFVCTRLGEGLLSALQPRWVRFSLERHLGRSVGSDLDNLPKNA